MDFVSKISKVLRTNSELACNQIQRGNPTPTSLVGKAILKLISTNEHVGIMNVVSSNSATRLEYIEEISKTINPDCHVYGATSYFRTAEVSANEAADNSKLTKFLGENIEDWRLSLNRALKERRN